MYRSFASVVGVVIYTLCVPFTLALEADKKLSLLTLSGVASHLESVQSIALEEGAALYNSCQETRISALDRDESVQRILQPLTLKKLAAEHLSERLNEQDQGVVRRWYSSAIGQKIQATEKRFEHASADAYHHQYADYKQSNALTKERSERIALLNRHLLVAEFVTAMNAEISATVAMIGECEIGSIGARNAQAAVQEARADREFITLLMRPELNADSAFVYAPLTDDELAVYLDFAQSEVGQRYHRALVASAENTLLQQNDKLSSALFQDPQ